MDVNVALNVFAYGGICAETVKSLLDELSTGRPGIGFAVKFWNEDALISRARSFALSSCLQSDAHVAAMVDHDISWRPGDLADLCQKASELGAVVGGIYAQRARHAGFASRLHGTPFQPGSEQLIEVEDLATGFWAIPITVADQIRQLMEGVTSELRINACNLRTTLPEPWPYFDFFRPMSGRGIVYSGEYLSEDYSFSRRAIAAGFRCYAYARPILTHHGLYGYTVEDA